MHLLNNTACESGPFFSAIGEAVAQSIDEMQEDLVYKEQKMSSDGVAVVMHI